MQSLFLYGVITLFGVFAAALFSVHVYVNLPVRKPAASARRIEDRQSATPAGA